MLLHVATRKGLLVYHRQDGDWSIASRHFLGDNVTLSLADPRSGRWYAALDHGHFGVKLHRSHDRGETWSEIAVPSYPQRPPEAGEEIGADGRPWPWSLKLIWALAPGGESQPGTLWCGTVPGGLFRSDDHGDSWQLVRGLWDHEDRRKWFGGGMDHPGIHSICVDPRDPQTLRIGVSSGGVWRSDDGGERWRCTADGLYAEYMPPEQRHVPYVQDVHFLVQCPAQPDSLWIQHHNGVFASRDGGESWQAFDDRPPAKFGFAVAVHPADGATAWFAPAAKDEHRIPVDGAVVVTRTRDGGAHWEVLRRGLPQQDAYDLVFRHSLQVATDGRTLAMGSTTGNLWLSPDGGDHWQQLSAHLPPIHALHWC